MNANEYRDPITGNRIPETMAERRRYQEHMEMSAGTQAQGHKYGWLNSRDHSGIYERATGRIVVVSYDLDAQERREVRDRNSDAELDRIVRAHK